MNKTVVVNKPFPPSLASKLAKLGVHQPQDFWWHLPLRYEDRSQLTNLQDLQPGLALVEALVQETHLAYRPRRQLVCTVQQADATLVLRFFHFYPNLLKVLKNSPRIRAYGSVRQGPFGWEMVHPELLPVDEPLRAGWTPIYPSSEGVSQKALRLRLERALRETDPPIDLLPTDLRRQFKLWDLPDALRFLHHPPPSIFLSSNDFSERRHPAWQRIKLHELLLQQLTLRQHYQARQQEKGITLPLPQELHLRLLAQLPFQLTEAQSRVTQEIFADLCSGKPMSRLVQGDVGSGKTIVAALTALGALAAGYQVALMAPTELLAQQHYQKFLHWFTPLGITVLLLSSTQRSADRQSTQSILESGQPAIVLGTHALFQAKVILPKLALIIIDEQHRFGVQQRLALLEKSFLHDRWRPHQLMMSATPIPRTLAMSLYADLDISTIDQLPTGRSPVLTRIFAQKKRPMLVERIRHLLQQGQQAYWVCPLIETSEKMDLQAAETSFLELRQWLPEFSIQLLHGRQKPDQRAATMKAFVAGEIDLLVATTVIEVGVDVPNATLMIIEHAERFGLAQLHQIRGRVGRGSQTSFCLLLYGAQLSSFAKDRLRILRDSQDGFLIAQEDLRLRGPGEFLGQKQSGLPALQYADLPQDADLLAIAQSIADQLLARYPSIARAYQQLGNEASWGKT